MPKYSIVIPTQQRHDTLYHSLRAALAIDYDDYEIVVQDNCSDEQTFKVVESFNSPKIVYRRSNIVLSMSDNWEQALQAATGEFIAFVGDDDALTINACKMCDLVIESTGSDVISWAPVLYWWPDSILKFSKNILYMQLSLESVRALRCQSTDVLRDYFLFKTNFSNLPMVYNSFVSKNVINKVINRVGRYFACSIPDVYSGIANCVMADTLIGLNRPLSIRGASGHSNGNAYLFRDCGAGEIRERFEKESLAKGRLYHPSLTNIVTNSLSLLQANVMLCARDDLFPDDKELFFDVSSLLSRMIDEMKVGHADYDQTLAAASDIASKNGFSLEIPPRPSHSWMECDRYRGAKIDEAGKISLSIDGDLAGIFNIYDAVCLVDAMSPRV